MNEKKIVKQYGGCEVTVTFSKYNPELKEAILWLMTENYMDRVKLEYDGNSELIQKQIPA